jgi:hypothetical protein
MWLSFPKEHRRNLSPELMERYAFVEAGGIPKKDAA